MKKISFSLLCLAAVLSFFLPGRALAKTSDGKQKLVLIAGKPSHPPRMHEYRAGMLLFQKCLADFPGLVVEVADDGWVKDEKTLDDADAIVLFADGGGNNPAIQGDHVVKLNGLMDRGVGLGCIHYAVEIPANHGGQEFERWIGGYYENNFSCNPLWEPKFDHLPNHPITRGVKPFSVKDEWYFSIRFADHFSADKSSTADDGTKFTPILVATPSDAVRKGPYVYPPGPYPHIVSASGHPEAMMWAVERKDGGRGFGYTGGHYHDNWANDDVRKTILNALVWVAKAEVPEKGVESKMAKEMMDQNLDKK